MLQNISIAYLYLGSRIIQSSFPSNPRWIAPTLVHIRKSRRRHGPKGQVRYKADGHRSVSAALLHLNCTLRPGYNYAWYRAEDLRILRFARKAFCMPVAQGIEQRFPVPYVGGSNPSRPLLLSSGNLQTTSLLSLPSLLCRQLVKGGTKRR